MTVEQQIMAKALENFGNISIANGYSFDINGKVAEWRETPLDPKSELPFVILRDYDNLTSEEDEQERLLMLEVVIVAAGGSAPDAVRAMKQDAIKAANLLSGESFVAGVYFYRAQSFSEIDNKRLAGVLMDFGVQYFTDYGEI